MKIQLLTLKAELKVLAQEIKTFKPATRQSNSILDKTFPQRHDWEQYKLIRDNEQYKDLNAKFYHNQSRLESLRHEFRVKHIARCMLRGKTLEQIEPKLRDPNSWHNIRARKEAAKIVTSVLEAMNAQAAIPQS
jgi:predicted  nucleic acid-binding Zn-ribbon protein